MTSRVIRFLNGLRLFLKKDFSGMVPQSSAQFAQWFGQLEQSAVQSTGQAANRFAKTASDFARFGDKSKEVQRNFTAAEVAQCTGVNGGCLYIIYDGKVLDLTDFVSHHSGGAAVLLKHGGRDASEAMRAAGMPPQVFDQFLQRFVIGRLVPSDSGSVAPSTARPAQSRRAAPSCGWLATSIGICEYIVRIKEIYEAYRGIIKRIFLRTDGDSDEVLKRLRLNNVTIVERI